MTDQELMSLAVEARKQSYSPYSSFRVGAALLAKSGKVYLGCNIENAAYTPTNCAERTALFKAVSEGEREFTAIAIVGGRGETIADFCAPCGVCRQVLAEFCVWYSATPTKSKRIPSRKFYPCLLGRTIWSKTL